MLAIVECTLATRGGATVAGAVGGATAAVGVVTLIRGGASLLTGSTDEDDMR